MNVRDERWLSKAHKRALHDSADLYNRIFDGMVELTDKKLAELKKAAQACSTTNCSAAEYRVGRILLPEIDHEVARRKKYKLKDGKPRAVGG
jgi:hypothetical protein